MSPHPQGGIFNTFYGGTDVSLDSRKNFHYFTEVVFHFIFIYVNKKILEKKFEFFLKEVIIKKILEKKMKMIYLLALLFS